MSIFAGLTFCCTGIESNERENLRKRIEGMGGQYSGHLTRKVTHLIAGRIIRSDKYKSSKETLGIPVLIPGFVDDCWTRSRLGGVDLKHMERLHEIPPLYGCQISVSGIPSEERLELASLVSQLGGQYSSELTKSCTHLLTRSLNGISHGPKVQFAVKWAIPIVDCSWLHACRDKNMYVDERAEHLVEVTASQQTPKITGSAYDDVTLDEVYSAKDVPQYLDGCLIYLGDALDDNRLALLKRLILVAGGTRLSDHYEGNITHFIVHNQVLSSREVDRLKRYQGEQPIVVHDQWLLACFVAKARLEPDVYRIDPYKAIKAGNSQATTIGSTSQQAQRTSVWSTKRSSQSQQNLQNIPPVPPTNWMVPHKKTVTPGTGLPLAIDTPPDSIPEASKASTLFKALTLYLHPNLLVRYQNRLISLGATLKDNPDSVDYAVFPPACVLTDQIGGVLKEKLVNEIWLVQCMAERRLLAPDDLPFFAPIISNRPIDKAEFSRLNVCPTGFSIPERDYFASLLTSLGGSFSEAFSKRNTHLLCKSGIQLTGPKIDFALKTGIPCVNEQWLLDCAKEGCVVALAPYKAACGDKKLKLGVLQEEEEKQTSNESTPEPIAKKTRIEVEGRISGPLNIPIFRHPTTSNIPTPKEAIPKSESSLPAVPVDTPLRRGFNQRIKQVTDDLLPKPDPDRPSLGPTQAITKESLSCLLNGLVFSISQRLWHRREELHDLVQGLGGTFLWSYDASCTHYLHQGNQVEESFREFRVAKHCGKHIVSPSWLLACRDEKQRVPEAEFPHYYPNNPLKQEAKDGLIVKPQPEQIRQVPVIHERRVSMASEPVEVPETYAATLDLVGKKNTNRIVTYAGIGDSEDEEPTSAEDVVLVNTNPDRPSSTEGISQCALGLTLNDNDARPKKFMLSAMTGPEKNALSKHVTELGATLCDQIEWDPTVTHLIVRQATKSEKYLAACAAGIWILRPDYLEASAAAKHFLPESEYEIQPAWTDSTVDGAIKSAPRAWRVHLGATGKAGAFADWTVLLAVDAKRTPGFTRILQAGHARVYMIADLDKLGDGVPPASEFTHVITSSHAMKGKIPASFASTLRPEVFKPIELIADHLLAPPRP